MKVTNKTTKNVKYQGRKCKLTTIYYTKSNEGKRLIIREFEDGVDNDIKLVEGLYGKYERKIPFKTFDTVETQTAYQNYLQNQEG